MEAEEAAAAERGAGGSPGDGAVGAVGGGGGVASPPPPRSCEGRVSRPRGSIPRGRQEGGALLRAKAAEAGHQGEEAPRVEQGAVRKIEEDRRGLSRRPLGAPGDSVEAFLSKQRREKVKKMVESYAASYAKAKK